MKTTSIIGQKNLLKSLKTLIDGGKLPRLIILVGAQGSGKGEVCNILGEMLDVPVIWCASKADDVRDVVERSYKTGAKVLNVFRDIDEMSQSAKNALLKVIEEPPNGAYFVMTSKDISNAALATIRSRGTVFYMDAYTADELKTYAKQKYTASDADLQAVANVCETPYDVDMLMSSDVKEFFSFVDLVVNNIATVSGSNSFKIGDRLSFKAGDGKYDLSLFWRVFMQRCSQKMQLDPLRYAEGISVTSKYLQDLSIAGINRQFTFDTWLLDIRSRWM